MKISVDLHSHSGYSGGVGKIDIRKYIQTLPLKGISVFGTGDCLHPTWNSYLKTSFTFNEETSLLKFTPDSPNFLLQTEIIFTAPISKGKKGVHTLILFPDFESIEKTTQLLIKKGMKNTIGRPFIKCSSKKEVSDTINSVLNIDEQIEVIPAHVMTPQGIYGSNRPVDSMESFYGESIENFHAVETGLSADPEILSLIPELDKFTLISNSDAHSHNLNRVGREFTELELPTISYEEIIHSIRKNKISLTGEFNPTEGRYFLSGHSDAKKNHNPKEFCIFSPQHTPKDRLCPICAKKLTIGVLERAFELREIQGGKERELGYIHKSRKPYISLVPLIEIISSVIGIKTLTSPKVTKEYYDIVSVFGSEIALFKTRKSEIIRRLEEKNINHNIIDGICAIIDKNFCFSPPGFDGTYGKLMIGTTEDYLDINKITHSPTNNPPNTLKDYL